MNNIGLDITAPPASRAILYFRFQQGMGGGIEQVEFDTLQTNLSQHRGADETAGDLCRDGYRAVVATSETGVGADAIEYTTNYLRSLPNIDALSITTTPPPLPPA